MFHQYACIVGMTMMCGSMRRYAQGQTTHTTDLMTRRRGGPTGRWRGNARLYYPHLQVPSIARPHQLIQSPSNSARISSKGITKNSQRIRAKRHPDPLQSHQNYFSAFQESRLTMVTMRVGTSASNKAHPCSSLTQLYHSAYVTISPKRCVVLNAPQLSSCIPLLMLL